MAYAERYPHRVEKLILISPVGIPEKRAEDDARMDSLPSYLRAVIRTARWLFERGVTPGSFLRSLPSSKSKSMVESYVRNRLPAVDCEEERSALSEYLYQNSMLPGSGECCLSHILTAGAFARVPLVHRIPELKGGGDDHMNVMDGMEVHFIYGENDWMDYKGGLDVQRACWKKRLEWERKLQEQKQEREREEIRSSNDSGDDASYSSPPPKVFVYGVRNAGHLLMLDNDQEFNAALIIAAGGEDKLPPHVCRPVEFVCDDIIADVGRGSNDRSTYLWSKKEVMDEEGAAAFFRGANWNRRFPKEGGSDLASENEGDRIEKKVKERSAR